MKTLKELTQSDYNFEPSNYISSGWKLLSKHFGPLVGMTLLFLIIGIALSSIPVISSLANLIGVILSAGLYIFLANSRSGKNDPKDFFGGFHYALDIVIHRLVLLLFLVPFVLVLFVLGFPFDAVFQLVAQMITPEEFIDVIQIKMFDNGMLFFLSILLLAAAGAYFFVSYIFTIPLIVIGKMKFWEAMETSRQVVGKKFVSYLLALIVLIILLSIMMIVTCGLGALVAVPLASCTVFCAFEAIFKPLDDPEKSALDEFGNSTGDSNSESD